MTWRTSDELRHVDRLGYHTVPHAKTVEERIKLLEGYLEGISLRQKWGPEMQPEVIRRHTENVLNELREMIKTKGS
jgi:hypothetical protein